MEWTVICIFFCCLSGRGQILLRQDQDLLPRWPSGLHGEAAGRATTSVLHHDAEARARQDRSPALPADQEVRPGAAKTRTRTAGKEVQPSLT